MNEKSKTLEKTLKIIEYLSKSNSPSGILEVSRNLNINTSTVQRIINTLNNESYLFQDPENKKYKLGFKFLEISKIILSRIDLRKIAHPYLKELRDKTNETVHLMIIDDSMGVYIDSLESSQRAKVVSPIGTRDDLHFSAVGKSILAYLSDKEIEEIVRARGLKRMTPKTITNLYTLKKELKIIRDKGYAIDDEEGEVGTRCIGAPIFKHNGKVVASVSIAAPCHRLTKEKLNTFLTLLLQTTSKISVELGYSSQ